MDFNIKDGCTTVTTNMTVLPNPILTADDDREATLELDGDETSIKLLVLQVDGRDLIKDVEYVMMPGKLIVKACAFKDGSGVGGGLVTTVVEIIPEDNTQLSGLYKSGSMYCSQCEAMGFRRITYYPDRPDNMAIFDSVRIEADKESYPILLGNGNLLESGDITSPPSDTTTTTERHYAIWQDPFPKPSYLFCIVAGKLSSITSSYTTKSGLPVELAIFSEPENVSKLDYAMDSLKRSMKWDEDKFGLEYDLGIYNIVAVNDFNMGAMENKGLNVFNTAYVLADPATATDGDYERVEAVIGHEYFHNWTGNRVTCRDWFQLTLKEGLTVFRDQEFSGDMAGGSGNAVVKRIENVAGLRGRQFAEDAGPMSHPIRPESYISMDNFYTATVYSKGAEIVRMYNTLLTPTGFRAGMDLYFSRHDGDGVTCDDFRHAMADANNIDLTQFGRWYSTPGTPTVTYDTSYDADGKVFTLTLMQNSNNEEGPLHIPVSVGLIDRGSGKEVMKTKVLELTKETQVWEFGDLEGDVVVSLLRDFSAPVKLVPKVDDSDKQEADLAFLAARDTDGFNRWEAGQKLFTSLVSQTMDGDANDGVFSLEDCATMKYVDEAFLRNLADDTMEYSIKAYALALPSVATLAEELQTSTSTPSISNDPLALHRARNKVKRTIALKHRAQLSALYDTLSATMDADPIFKVDATSIGRRRLRNTLISYLTSIRHSPEERYAAAELATSHYQLASGMTDKVAALSALAGMDGEEAAPARDEALRRFYEEANGDPLVLDKWFSIQASADLPDVLERVRELKTTHPDFSLTNPNRFRSLIGAFTANVAGFHAEDGGGYRFVGECIKEMDGLNPQVSSRLATSLVGWKKYGDSEKEGRGMMMKSELEKLSEGGGLSEDLFEVVSRGLK